MGGFGSSNSLGFPYTPQNYLLQSVNTLIDVSEGVVLYFR